MPPRQLYQEDRTVRLMRPQEAQDAALMGSNTPSQAGLAMLNRLMAGYAPSRLGPDLGLVRHGVDVVRGIFPQSGISRLVAQSIDAYLDAGQQGEWVPPLPISPMQLSEVNRRLGVRAQQRAHGFIPPGMTARSQPSGSKCDKATASSPLDQLRALAKAKLGSTRSGPHKYIKREREGNKWVYTYPGDEKQPKRAAVEVPAKKKVVPPQKPVAGKEKAAVGPLPDELRVKKTPPLKVKVGAATSAEGSGKVKEPIRRKRRKRRKVRAKTAAAPKTEGADTPKQPVRRKRRKKRRVSVKRPVAPTTKPTPEPAPEPVKKPKAPVPAPTPKPVDPPVVAPKTKAPPKPRVKRQPMAAPVPEVKAPKTEATLEIERHIRRVDTWHPNNLAGELNFFHKATGVDLSHTSYKGAESIIPALQGAAKQVLRAQAVLRNIPHISRLSVDVFGPNSPSGHHNARYVMFNRAIQVNVQKGKHSFVHELGHFLDHAMGNIDIPDSGGMLTTEVDEGKLSSPRAQAMKNFLDAAKKTHSAKAWKDYTKDSKSRRSYLFNSSEMVARYLDHYVYQKAVQKGLPESSGYENPEYKYGPINGGYTRHDVKELAPMFEKILGDELLRSLVDLLKARFSSLPRANKGTRTHKYIKRERKGNTWVYTYPEDVKNTEGTSSTSGKPSPKDEPKPAQSKSSDEIAKQLKSINGWTAKGIDVKLRAFRTDTGINLHRSVETTPSTSVKTLQMAARQIVAVQSVFRASTKDTMHLSVVVSSSLGQDAPDSALAKYSAEDKRITINQKTGTHSFVHEFGHFIDHALGDFGASERTLAFMTERPTVAPGKDISRHKAAKEFIAAAKKTESYRHWQAWSGGPKTAHSQYLTRPTEIFARFFDYWTHNKLKAKGLDAKSLGSNPSAFYEHPTEGKFTDADVAALTPLFEKILGKDLMKSLLDMFKDALLAKAGLPRAPRAGGHKYIKRERKGDKWVYTYPGDPQEPSSHNVATPPAAPSSGTSATLAADVAQFKKWGPKDASMAQAYVLKRTGVHLEIDSKLNPTQAIETFKGTALQVLAAHQLVKIASLPVNELRVSIVSDQAGAAAIYRTDNKTIEIGAKDGVHTFFHEFGHFIDHARGDFEGRHRGMISGFQSDFIANNPGAARDAAKPLLEFLREVYQSKSHSAWKKKYGRVMDVEHLQYLKRPTEIFARFFDYWVHEKLKKSGIDPATFHSDPEASYFFGGAFSPEDVAKLTPAFEKALGESLVKSLLDLFKAAYIKQGTPESKAAWRRATGIAGKQGHSEPAYVAHIWRALTGKDASISQKTLKRWARNRARRAKTAEARAKREKAAQRRQKTEKVTHKSTRPETKIAHTPTDPIAESPMPTPEPKALTTLARLAKSASGPGSRGGHILAYSRQGTPIYKVSHRLNAHAVAAMGAKNGDSDPIAAGAHALGSSHSHYSRNDHLDAADAHATHAGVTTDRTERHQSHQMSQAHSYASFQAKKALGNQRIEHLLSRLRA